jgi:hypothetical protein
MADEMDSLMTKVTPKDDYVSATFKSTQLILQPSTEVVGKGDFDFAISHHLKPIYPGYESMFGLDGANIRLQMELGLFDGFEVKLGRTGSGKKPVDLDLKYQVLRQKTSGMPLTVTVQLAQFWSTSFTKGDTITQVGLTDKRRFTEVGDLLVARKWTERFSTELIGAYDLRYLYQDSVTWTYKYKTGTKIKIDSSSTSYKGQYASPILGVGGRFKLSQRVSALGDIAWNLATNNAMAGRPVFGIGIDIDTGGHVFEIFLTNQSWDDDAAVLDEPPGGIQQNTRLGFMIHRTFSFWK